MKKRDPKKIESIFESTLTLVREKGLVGITMAEIAKNAHIATGTLYIYFPSKEELFHALYRETKVSIANFLFFKEGEEKLPYKEQFFIIAERYLDYRRTFYDASVFHEQYKRSLFYTENDARISEETLTPILAFLREGQKQNLLKNEDTNFLLSIAVSIVQSYVNDLHFGLRDEDSFSRDMLINCIWDSLSLHS